MSHYIISMLIAIFVVLAALKLLESHQMLLSKHDSRLIEHHNTISESIRCIHNEVEQVKQIALDNNNKLDILLNIATNNVQFTDK